MTPEVSVIIPAYNAEAFLRQAIESVLGQPGLPIEVIVVDDGSTDATAQIAAQFEEVTYVWKPNGGSASARNLGFTRASSPCVVFLDADDWLEPGGVEALKERLDRAVDVDMVFGDASVVREGTRVGLQSDAWHDSPTWLTRGLLNSIPVVRCAMFRRSILEQLSGPFDEALVGYEDWDLALRLARIGASIEQIDACVASYRMHPRNKSASDSAWSERRRESMLAIKRGVIEQPEWDAADQAARYGFLYTYLVHDLSGATAEQNRGLESRMAQGLAVRRRAALYYYAGVEALDRGDVEAASARMARAQALVPGGILPRIGSLGLRLSPGLLRSAIRLRRRFGSAVGGHVAPRTLPLGATR